MSTALERDRVDRVLAASVDVSGAARSLGPVFPATAARRPRADTNSERCFMNDEEKIVSEDSTCGATHHDCPNSWKGTCDRDGSHSGSHHCSSCNMAF